MAPRIAEEIWEQHRNEITALYCAPKPEGTLKKTMQTMKEKYGFQATKSQYTTKFEAWGLQKYADNTIWVYAAQKSRRRQLEGKDTEFVIHARKRARQEVEKEISRNVTHASRLQLFQDIPTPEGVQAFTPGAGVSSTSVTFREVCTSNLPSVQLQKVILALMSENRQIYKSDTFPTTDNPRTPILPSSDIPAQSNSQFNSRDSQASAARSQQTGLRETVDSAMSSAFRDSLSKEPILLTSYFPLSEIDNDRMLSSHGLEGFGTQLKLLQDFIVLTNNGEVIPRSQLGKGVEWILAILNEYFLLELLSRQTTMIKLFVRKILPAVVACGNTKLVRCILKSHSDILNIISYRYRSWCFTEQEECMSIAVANGDCQMIELLCTLGLLPQIFSGLSIPDPKLLWDKANPATLRTLLSFGADPECFIVNKPRGYPLVEAAKSGSLEAVKILLKGGSSVNVYVQKYFGTPLQAAVWAGHLEMVEFLIACGADINAPFGPQYQMPTPDDCVDACDDCSNECTCMREQPTYWSMNTPIQIACAKDNAPLVGLLLTHGANVNLSTVSQIDLNDYEDYLLFCRHDYRYVTWYSRRWNGVEFLTALQHSAQNGNNDLVRLLLSNGAYPDLRAIPDWEDTPLQLAIRLGYTEIALILIDHGANVNASPGRYNGRTAIQAAAESGNIQIAQMLLRRNADINATAGYEKGLTALQAAINGNHPLMAGFLYSASVNINAPSARKNGITAILAAAEAGDVNLVYDLLDQGADMSNAAAGHRAILASVLHKNLSMLNLFVEHGAPIDGQGSNDMPPIFASVFFDWIIGARFLLNNGADINSYYHDDHRDSKISTLAWSIMNNSIDMIKLLMERGASLCFPLAKSPYNDSLCLALDNLCPMEIVYTLLDEYTKANPFSLDLEVLATAVCNEHDDDDLTRTKTILNVMTRLPKSSYVAHVRNAWDNLIAHRGSLFSFRARNEKLASQIIRLLLNAGADINSVHPSMKCTLLQAAVHGKNIDLAKTLIEEGADIQGIVSYSRGTPLQTAIEDNEIDFAHLLLERGADINVSPAESLGTTALQAAANNGNRNLVLLLLERGAAVNAPPAKYSGVTALQATAIKGYIDIAIDLLRHGAHVAAPGATNHGRTAIDGAAEHGHEDMLQLLLNHYDGCEGLSVVCERAATYAEKEGHGEIASWLRQYPSLSTDGK